MTERLEAVVGRTLERLGIAARVQKAVVVGEWDRVVGPHIAGVARAVRVSGDTLFVAVDSAAWRNELSLMRPSLLARLNAGKREGRIERIVFLPSDGRGIGGVDGKA